MNREEHIKRHKELHHALDELCADFFVHTGKLFSKTNIATLMKWSNIQTTNPAEPTKADEELKEKE